MTSSSGVAGARVDRATEVFVSERPRLVGIAGRILRDRNEAEDIVQDAWLRWQGADRALVRNPQAFLVATTTRLALNQVRSARCRRETVVDPWLQEPPASTADPELDAVRGEAVGEAVMIMLATLTSSERAAYVLREAFDYRYERIAELLGLSAVNCRQLVRRARQAMTSDRRRLVSVAAHERFLRIFLAAAHDGHLADLERLLVADAAARVITRDASDVRVAAC